MLGQCGLGEATQAPALLSLSDNLGVQRTWGYKYQVSGEISRVPYFLAVRTVSVGSFTCWSWADNSGGVNLHQTEARSQVPSASLVSRVLQSSSLASCAVQGQLGSLLTPVLTGPGPLLHPCSGGSHCLGHRAWAVLIVPPQALDTSVSGPCLQPQPVWVRWTCVVPAAVPLCAGETAFWKRKELVSKGLSWQWGEVGSGLYFSEC